ncbi:MAG: GNAT family N-acetyltransferase [Paraclostridium sp.]
MKVNNSQYTQMKTIESEKFTLRPATLDDASDLFEYYSQEKALKYLPIQPHQNIKETEKFIQEFFIDNYLKGLVGHWVIFFKEDNKVIGHLGLNNIDKNSIEAEIGIAINPNYWGRDFATELTIFTIKYGFEYLNIEKLVAMTSKSNKHTRKSLESLGFEYVGRYIKKEMTYSGIKYMDCDTYHLLRKNYKSTN